MANLALHNTTLLELQNFLQKSAMPLSEKFTVIFDHEASDFNIINENQQHNARVTTTQPFDDFTKDEFFGMWADREDMKDSTEYIRKLRQEQWTRNT